MASIRILDKNQQVLATSGMEKTRQGEVFVRDALKNEEKVGTVEITLIRPSIGEILRTQWLAIVSALILHFLIWLAYRTIARPTRSEYLARINQENYFKHEIQRLTQALELEKQNTITLVAQAQQQAQAQPQAIEEPIQLDPNCLTLNLQFYDPKQLLNSVNQSVSLPYFKLCQLFLDKSISLCTQHYQIETDQIKVQQEFTAEGAILSVDTQQPQTIECLMMINAVFNLLAEVLYKRYREDKRFALQTRSAISSMVEAMQLNATEASKRLNQSLHAKQAALYLPQEQLKYIQDRYHLVPMPNPNNLLTRHAYLINGMNEQCANLAQSIRTEILMGKKAQAADEEA